LIVGSVLAVVSAGAALAGDETAAPDLTVLAPLEPLTSEAVITKTEMRDIVQQQTYRVVPTSAASDLIDSFEYNLEKLDVSGFADYDGSLFLGQSRAVIWDIAAVYGLTTFFGLKNWDWGSSGFHFENEGWFGEDTKYGGMDKLGHAYTGYLLTEYFSQRVAHEVSDPNGAIITGAILGMGVQSYIEFFDGFSGGHGFSYEDFIADGLGVGFSILRNTVPEIGEKLDFRMEYIQSDYSDFAPVTDYAGQKYVLALKLSGFEELEETPLRFVELQAGYFTQGYTDAERDAGVDQRREPYLAIGLNLNELLKQAPEVHDTLPGLMASRAFEYIQVPYTYVPTSSR
jgi:hypothetical protein